MESYPKNSGFLLKILLKITRHKKSCAKFNIIIHYNIYFTLTILLANCKY